MLQTTFRPALVSTILAAAIWVTAPTTIRAAEFIVLDEVLSQQTTLNAVSGDGSMVVGSVWPGPTAMVWTHDGGIMGLPGGIRAAVDVNFDGTLVVGDSISDADLVRWENGVLLPPLGLPGALENPSSQRINSDGTVITLAARPDGTDENEILRWTQDVGFTSLTGPPGGAAINRPNAISADGSVIVGYAHGFGAMRWTETTGIVGLGGSEANGVSADGSIVAGQWRPDGINLEPFRWTAGTGLVGLEHLPGFPNGTATNVSSDGAFLVGHSFGAPGPLLQDAWLWAEQTGARRLVDVLVNDHNLDIGDIGDFTRLRVGDISDDGRVLVGFLERPSSTTDKGWVAILDRPLFTLSCDFNGNGSCNIDDIDALIMEIATGTNDPSFDLNHDGLVNGADRDEWLAAAGALNLPSGNPYLVADFDLDGTVDGNDFVVWNSHKFAVSGRWSFGDANGDGTTDGSDFIEWNANKFMSADGASAVPEPGFGILLASVLLGLAFVGRR